MWQNRFHNQLPILGALLVEKKLQRKAITNGIKYCIISLMICPYQSCRTTLQTILTNQPTCHIIQASSNCHHRRLLSLFENTSNRITNLPLDSILNCFVFCLKTHLKNEILLRPITISDAISLARLIENKMAYSRPSLNCNNFNKSYTLPLHTMSAYSFTNTNRGPFLHH